MSATWGPDRPGGPRASWQRASSGPWDGWIVGQLGGPPFTVWDEHRTTQLAGPFDRVQNAWDAIGVAVHRMDHGDADPWA